jgi:site-specific DNA-methyltransferase (adenine-specific)
LEAIETFVGRILHGDCTTVLPLLPATSIDLIITDPPYLVNYHPRDGRLCSGDDSDRWLRPSVRELYRVLKPDSFFITFYGWPWIERFMAAWRECGFRPISHLSWVKSHCSREGYTRSFHEVGYLLAKGKPPKPENAPADVLPWEYTGNELHPNQKPVIAITPLIEAYSEPGAIVLDPFCGSGTTGVAATICQRQFILIEKDAHHCQTAAKRLRL